MSEQTILLSTATDPRPWTQWMLVAATRGPTRPRRHEPFTERVPRALWGTIEVRQVRKLRTM